MFGNYDFSQIFKRDPITGDFKKSVLADHSRFNLLFSERDESNPYSFLEGSFYTIAEEYADQNPSATESETINAVNFKAISGFGADVDSVVSDASSVFKRVFSKFETRNLFNEESTNEMFGRELLYQFTDYLTKSKTEREKIAEANSLFGYADAKFNELVSRELKQSVSASRQIREDLNLFQRSIPSEINRVTGGGLNRAQKLLDNVDYVNRPGILPAVALASQANQTLSVDIFQMQNKSIQDFYATKILQEALDFRSGKRSDRFTINVRMAFPLDEMPEDSKTFDILGPNLVFYRKLELMKDIYGDAVNINFSFADRKSHPKFLISEDTAIIGSQNLTRPVGNSVFQAGSNYETLRVLHYKVDGYTPAQLEEANNKRLINTDDLDSGSLLFMQARQVNEKIQRGEKFLSTGLRNVAGPRETYEHLKATLEYASQNRNTEMGLVLDQVFLLQHEKDLFSRQRRGEMGDFGEEFLDKNANSFDRLADNYQTMQRQLLHLIIEGRANVIVDSRNYREKVLDPVFSRLQETSIFKDYGINNYDPVELVRKLATGRTAAARIDTLTNALGQYKLGEDMAVQLLAMTSGRIEMAAVPRQHVKAYALVDRESGESLAYSAGSSNFGFYSLAQVKGALEAARVNFELGLQFASDKVKSLSGFLKSQGTVGFGLSGNQEQEEVVAGVRNFIQIQRDLGRRQLGQMEYTDVRTDWHSSVNRDKLFELESSLRRINNYVGQDLIRIERGFDNFGRVVELNVGFNTLENTGAAARNINMKFSATKDFIYAVNENKMIGLSEFVNQSSSVLYTGFEREGAPLIIEPGQRTTLNAVESATAMIASLSTEITSIGLIKEPVKEFRNRFMNNRSLMESGVANYFAKLVGEPALTAKDLLNLPAEHFRQASVLNIESRFNNREGFIGRIKDLNNTPDGSRSGVEKLSNLMLIFAENNAAGRQRMLQGRGQPELDLVRQFENIVLNPENVDILHDFISSQKDSSYNFEIDRQIKDLKDKFMSPYLTRTQVSTYGYSQALRKRPVYGFDNSRIQALDVISKASRSNNPGINRLNSLALLVSPYAFGPTSRMGAGDAVYIPVAEGGGSRQEKESFLYNLFPNLLPYYNHQTIGDVTGLEIIQDASVGAIVKQGNIESYLTQIENELGSEFKGQIAGDVQNNLDKLGGTAFIFNFDRIKKASQIPQRIKNVIGTRPLNDLTVEYQTLADNLKSTVYRNRFSNVGQVNQIKNVRDLQKHYLKDLSGALGVELDESFSIGALYGNKIRRFLSEEIARELEAERYELMTQFGLSPEETQSGAGAELLRTRLVMRDLGVEGLKGFTGSSERGGKTPVMLFQLSGAYSDYYYANPVFGGEEGLRRGFFDRSVKNFQASKLRATISTTDLSQALGVDSWTFEKNLAVQAGEILSYDVNDNKTYVYRLDERTGEYAKNRVVDDRAQFKIVGNIIERLDKQPSFSYLTATSNAASIVGQDAREIIREVRIIRPDLEANAIQIELVFDRTMKDSGGQRSEAYGGLFKGVPIFVKSKFFQDILSGIDADLDIHQVQGLANPSNFKSYMYSHGAAILTDEMKFGRLMSSSSKELAAALLLGTGLSSDEVEQARSLGLFEELGSQARSGGLGTYLKNVSDITRLMQKTDSNAEIGEALLNEINSKRDLSGASLQLASLRYLSLNNLKEALSGQRDISGELNKIFSSSSRQVEYLRGDMRGRELALLAGNVDVFLQIMKQKELQRITTVDVTEDDYAYKALGTVGGATYQELLEDREGLSALIQSQSELTPVIYLHAPVAGSQAKVPMSSRDKARIETQHILADPFTPQIKAFQKGGSIDALRRVVASVIGLATDISAGHVLSESNNLESLRSYDVLDPYIRSPLFKSKLMGVYTPGVINQTAFNKLNKEYEIFGLLQLSTSKSGFNDSDFEAMNSLVKDKRWKSVELSGISDAIENRDFQRLKTISETRLALAMRGIQEIATQYKLYEDKAFEVESAEAMSKLLPADLKTMGFSFPSMQIVGNQIRFDKNVRQHSLLLSGESLKTLGEQYGSFVTNEFKDTLILAQGLAEGSEVSNLFNQIALIDEERGFIEVDLETAQAAEKFQNTAVNLFSHLSESVQGAKLAGVTGNKIGFDGGTVTGAAMFGIPERGMMIAETLANRQGQLVASSREQALDHVSNYRRKIVNRLSKVRGSIPRTKFRAEQNLASALDLALTSESRTARYETKERVLKQQNQLLRSQERAFSGISQTGTYLYNSILKKSEEFRKEIAEANSDSSLHRISEKITQELNEFRRLGIEERGDSYIKNLAIAELQVLQYQAEEKMGNKSASFVDSKLRAKDLMKVPQFIAGNLLVGSKSKVGLDEKISIDSLSGELFKHESSLQRKLRFEANLKNSSAVQQGIQTIRGVVQEQQKLLTTGYEDLFSKSELASRFKKMNSVLDQLERRVSRTKDAYEINEVNNSLEREVTRFFTELSLTQAQAFRSAPPGSEFQSFSKFNIFHLQEVNAKISASGYSFELDENRNKTLALFNPISFQQTHLGDFDGDSHSVIFNYTSKLKLLAALDNNKIDGLNKEIEDLIAKQSSTSSSQDKTSLQSKINDLTKRRDRKKAELKEVEATIKRAESTYEYSNYEQSVRKWVANYLKVDERIFTSREKGGFGNVDVDTPALFTLIEQGRGLFGGMEDAVAKSKGLFDTLLSIGKDRESLQSQDRFKSLLAQADPSNELLKFLRENADLSEEIRGVLVNSYNHEKGYVYGVADYVGTLTAKQGALGELQKYAGKGLGTAMSDTTFDMMLKTLGQAGSKILGKTYNSTIGLLLSESPMLAVGYAMETDGDLRDQFKATYGEDELSKLEVQIREVKAKSENMGGFLQSVHQLMRDSIKPKNSESFLRTLNERMEAFQTASSDEERDDIVDAIVRDFGPGAGLKGVIQVERLVQNLQELNKTYTDETDREVQGKLLYKKFGVDSSLESELSQRLGFERKEHAVRLFEDSSNPEVNQLTRQYSQTSIIAGYKTKQDFLNLTAGFAFTKAIANEDSTVTAGKSQAKSSGRALVDMVRVALENPNSDLKSAYGHYIKAADDFYSKNLNKSQFSLEQQEYIDAVKTLYDINVNEEGKSTGIEYSKLNSAEKYLHAMTYVKTRNQMEPFAGRYGEGLLKIAGYEQTRSKIYGGEARISGDDWQWSESGVMLANIQALQSGKIDSKAVANMFGTLQESFRRYTGNPNATQEDVLNAMLSMGSLSETPAQKEAASKLKDFIYRSKGSADKIMSTARNTAFGQVATTLMTLIDPSQYEAKNTITEVLIERGLNREAATNVNKLIQNAALKTVLPEGEEQLDHQIRSALQEMSGRVAKPVLTKSDSMVARAVLNNTGDHALNIVGIPLLGIIGSALASGNVSADAMQQFAGNAISALAYTRPGMLVKNSKPLTALANAGASMGFKMRMALEEQEGDAGKALVVTAAREAGMALVTSSLTQSISDAVETGLGKRISLDHDKYEGIRGIVGNGVGAMASTLLGMFLGETLAKTVVAPQPSEVANIITAAQNTALEMQQAMGVAEEIASDEFDIVDSQEGLVEYITYQSFSSESFPPDTFAEDLNEQPTQLLDGESNSAGYFYNPE